MGLIVFISFLGDTASGLFQAILGSFGIAVNAILVPCCSDRDRLAAATITCSLRASMLPVWSKFWRVMREHKRYWLLPSIIMTVILVGLILLTEGSTIATFLYTPF
jgi:hypothetical protein